MCVIFKFFSELNTFEIETLKEEVDLFSFSNYGICCFIVNFGYAWLLLL